MSFDSIEEKVKHLIKPHFRVYFDLMKPEISNKNYLGGYPYISYNSKWPSCDGCNKKANFLLQFNKKYNEDLHLIKIFYCECDGEFKFYFMNEVNPDKKDMLPVDVIEEKGQDTIVSDQYLLDMDLGWNAPSYQALRLIDSKVFSDVNLILSTLEKPSPQGAISKEDFYEDFRYITDLVPDIGVHTICGYPEGFHPNSKLCNNCGKEHSLLLQLNGDFLQRDDLKGTTVIVFECKCKKNKFKVVVG